MDGRGRRRAAILPGARLPAELLAHLAAEQAESGDSGAAGTDTVEHEEEHDGSSDGGVAVEVADEGAAWAPADDAKPAAGSTAGVTAAGQQAVHPEGQLPAYTSLARRQLHARMKAAIAAGTSSAAAAPTVGTAVTGQQQRRERGAASPLPSSGATWGLAGAAPAISVPSALLPPLGAHASAISSGSYAAAGADSSAAAPSLPLLPLPATDLDESSGFQLPMPCRQSCVQLQPRRAGSPERAALCSVPSNLAPAAGTSGGTAPPHWLAAQLQQQHPYHRVSAQAPMPHRRPQQQKQQQQQQGVQRGLLSLLMPPLTDRFLDLMPVRVVDSAGRPCLLVLPSDGPSSRQEAAAASAALQQLLADPAAAAHRAAAWRKRLLLGSSSAALLGLTADYTPKQLEQQLRPLGQGGASRGLLAGPSWLAATCNTISGGSSGGINSSSAGQPSAAVALQAVRRSSTFLRTESSCSFARSSSPLPPLPRAESRLAAGDSRESISAAAGGGGGGCLPQLPPLPEVAPPPHAAAADPTWDGYCQASLAAALAVCTAEAVRQVEVGCAERGRLLAQLWNAYTGVLAATLQQQAEQVERLSAANANLSAEVSQLRWEASSLDFLRKEIGRLRKDHEAVGLALEDSRSEVAALREALVAAEEQQGALAAHIRRRLAVLRWRHATAVVLTPAARLGGRMQPSSSTGAADTPGEGLLQQVAALEHAAAAVPEARQRQQQWRQAKRAEAAVAAALSTNKQQQQQQALSRFHSPSGSGAVGSSTLGGGKAGLASSLSLLHCLQPEARAALLLSLPQQQRVQALAAMSDAERASLMLALDETARLQMYSELGSALAVSTDAYIWRKPLLLAKLLASVPPEQASAQLGERASPQQQAAVLQVLSPQRAAALLLAQPAGAQQRLLLSILPAAAAALLGWVPPSAGLQLLLAACPTAISTGPSSSSSGGSSNSGGGGGGGGESGGRGGGGGGSSSGSSGERGSGWLAGVVEALPDLHFSAMLAAGPPAELGVLLLVLSAQQQQRLLGMLPSLVRAAALAALHLQQAAAARRAAAGSEAAGPTAAEVAEAADDAFPGALDPATALMAHFQLLSPAEKTHTLLMGPAAAAALLLPLLADSELADVMLLLPQQRQAEMLAALHPSQARRVAGGMRAAERRRSSLLLPQQVAAMAAAAGEEGGEPLGEAVGEPSRPRWASSLLQPSATSGRRPSQLATSPAARPSSSGGSRRGSLLAPQQPLERRGSRAVVPDGS